MNKIIALYSWLAMRREDLRLFNANGFQRGGLLYVWPWLWPQNQWRPCWSIDYGFACWPWQPWQITRRWVREVREWKEQTNHD